MMITKYFPLSSSSKSTEFIFESEMGEIQKQEMNQTIKESHKLQYR